MFLPCTSTECVVRFSVDPPPLLSLLKANGVVLLLHVALEEPIPYPNRRGPMTHRSAACALGNRLGEPDVRPRRQQREGTHPAAQPTPRKTGTQGRKRKRRQEGQPADTLHSEGDGTPTPHVPATSDSPGELRKTRKEITERHTKTKQTRQDVRKARRAPNINKAPIRLTHSGEQARRRVGWHHFLRIQRRVTAPQTEHEMRPAEQPFHFVSPTPTPTDSIHQPHEQQGGNAANGRDGIPLTHSSSFSRLPAK